MYTLETKNLSYQFSKTAVVLNNLNLAVPQGAIYGFLGPNGAGKTTSLRLVLGLLKKQKGEINFFGKPFENNRLRSLKKIGSLIESPSLYSQLSASENLQVLQKIYQCPPARIAEVLALVGLEHTKNKKSGQFSLGMKQRLSIAISLLHSPELLILDEPTNGLDPNGILEMRELLKKLNRERGITIVVSSHLLTEIEKLVSHVGLIHKGNLLFQGSLEQLMGRQKLCSGLAISTSNNNTALMVIQREHPEATIGENKVLLPLPEKRVIAALNKKLVEAGVEVYEINQVKNDLESIFMDLTNN